MSGCGHACRACADSRRRRSLVPLSLAPIPVDGDKPDWHTAQDWVAVATERVGELAGGHSRLCGRLWRGLIERASGCGPVDFWLVAVPISSCCA